MGQMDTHFCKFPGCAREAKSMRGPYSYCDEHRGKLPPARAAATESTSGTQTALRALLKQAAQVDRLDARAAKALADARDAREKADEARREYAAALSRAASQ